MRTSSQLGRRRREAELQVLSRAQAQCHTAAQPLWSSVSLPSGLKMNKKHSNITYNVYVYIQ